MIGKILGMIKRILKFIGFILFLFIFFIVFIVLIIAEIFQKDNDIDPIIHSRDGKVVDIEKYKENRNG